MPVPIERFEKSVIRDRVFTAIEKALLSGALKAGDRVVEAEIAREAGVSRGPVREAVQQLVGEGFLVKIPQRGTFVALYTASDVVETYGMRAQLEGYAVRLAMPHLTDQEMGELGTIVEEMFARAHESDTVALSDLDRQFHYLLYDMSGHKLLARTLKDLWRKVSMMVNFDVRTTPDLLQHAENHRMLLGALREMGGDEAERAFRQHIESYGGIIASRIKEEGLASGTTHRRLMEGSYEVMTSNEGRQ